MDIVMLWASAALAGFEHRQVFAALGARLQVHLILVHLVHKAILPAHRYF